MRCKLCRENDIKIRVGHRMSMDSNKSLFTNLMDTVQYKINKAVYDPEADKFAEMKRAKEEARVASKVMEGLENDGMNPEASKLKEEKKEEASTEEPSSAKRTWDKIVSIFSKIIFPIFCLSLASLVANDMIVYSSSMRLLFFLFTFFICYFTTIFAYVLAFYYLIRMGYHHHLNKSTEGPKYTLLPKIFAFLPVTTSIPESTIGRFFKYPFTYPKTEGDKEKLPSVMAGYWNQLMESFPGLEQVKRLPIFVKDLKEVKNTLEHMHDIPVIESAVPNTVEKNSASEPKGV